VICTAARWHDVGKAHKDFQKFLLDPCEKDDKIIPPPTQGELWAKSSHAKGRHVRRHFRHELVSLLSFLKDLKEETIETKLVAYLIASHHGKIRVYLHSLSDDDEDCCYGVSFNDKEIPSVLLPNGEYAS